MIKKLLLLVIFTVCSGLVFGQLPTSKLRIANVKVDTVNAISFEVWLKNTSTDTIRYSGGQYHLDFNKEVLNGGTGTYTLVGSGLPASFALKNPTVFVTSTPGQLRTASNTLPGAGNGYQLLPAAEVMIFKGKLATNAAAIGSVSPSLKWRVAPMTNPVTKFGCYIGVTNTEIQSVCTFQDSIPVVPVELSAFTALADGRDVILQWKTTTEKNTDRFEIERTTADNPNSWSKVGTVQAAGTSTKEKSYTFTDLRLGANSFSYRLKMIDLDGSYSYSAVENTMVNVPKEFAVSQNYPNPFNPSTKIEYQVPADARVKVEIFNVNGEKIADLINKDQVAGYYTVDMNASSYNLPSGIYIFRMSAQQVKTGARFSATKKMVLIK